MSFDIEAYRAWPTKNKKQLIIMRGIPSTGKSTTAKELAGEKGVICSADNYFVDDDGSYKFDASKLGNAHDYCRNVCRLAMVAGREPIIIDNTNTTEKEWKPYTDLAEEYDYRVEFRLPDYERYAVLYNILENQDWKNNPLLESCVEVFVKELAHVSLEKGHKVPIEALERMVARWQPTPKG